LQYTLEYLLSVVEGAKHDYTPTPAEQQLAETLIALEQEEDEVSTARQRLHIRLGVVPSPDLEHRERELSARRRELHQRIDSLRAELGNLGWTRTTDTNGRTGRAT
jgi:hypothetical protein